jgi:hypothetical protein
MVFCDCEDWLGIKDSNPSIFKWHETYGWVISWIELTEERSHHQIHNYGVSINFCPFCGNKLTPGD